MKKALNITVMLLVLAALSFSLISCNGEAEEKVNEVLGTDVKLNGTWKSEPISYRHDGKDYSGAVELRFNDTQLQIVAPHGISKIHRYTRSGITLTITDAYVSEDNPYRHLPFALEFAGGGFSVDLGGLTFTEGMSNIKLKFTKTSDSATIKEPEKGEEKPDIPVNPDVPVNPDMPVNPDVPQGPTSLDAFVIEGTTLKGLTDYGKTIKSIIIPDGITAIGEGAFFYCTNLTDVSIPTSVKTIGSGAFCGCSNMSYVTIPDSVTTIGENAFKSCLNLAYVTISESVKLIGDNTFIGCDRLSDIYINQYKNDLLVNSGLAENCDIHWNSTGPGPTPLEAFVIEETTLKGLTDYGKTIQSIIIPDEIKYIGSEAFVNCDNLLYVTIPDGVTSKYKFF